MRHVRQRIRWAPERRTHADLFGVPGDGGDPRQRAGRARGARPRRAADRGSAVAAVEQRLADSARRAASSPPSASRRRKQAVSNPKQLWRATVVTLSALREPRRPSASANLVPRPARRTTAAARAGSRSTTSSAFEMLKFHELTVAQVSPDAEDAVSVALGVPLELQAEYRGSPGQHVVVRLPIDGEDTRRTYSLVNAPGEWPLRIVPRVHADGKMSRYLAEVLRAGERVEVLPPNGSFTPAPRQGRRDLRGVRRRLRHHAGAVHRALAAGARTHACHPLLWQHRHGTHHVPGGAAGAQGPLRRAAVAAFRHESRATGGRALQRPDRCAARAPARGDAVCGAAGGGVFRLRSRAT